MFFKPFKAGLLSTLLLLLTGVAAVAQKSPTPLNYDGTVIEEDFDTLANSTTTLPPGFGFVETGSNANTSYQVSDGSGASVAGDTYSFGATGDTDRALGSIRSNAVASTFGISIRNDTGTTLTQFTVSYNGEQFRVGGSGASDRLDFSYSTSATTLDAATGFIDADALDFSSSITTGSARGVTATTPITSTVTGLSIAPGAILTLRFVDFDVSSADDGLAIDDFSFSTPSSETDPTPSTTPLPTPIPTGPSTGALISEYRLGGPGSGSNSNLDELIEIFNATNSPLDLAGWSVGAGGVTIPIPSGKTIPAKGHLLLTNSGGYTLANYGGTDAAKGDILYTGDIALGSTLTLRNASGTTVDEVTSVGLTPTTATSQYSYARRLDMNTGLASSIPSDFNLVDVGATTFGPDSVGDTSNGKVRLGSPGPENLSSPLNRSVLYTNLSQDASQNTVRNASDTSVAPLGTLSLRRTVTNNTGTTLTKVRFRLINTTSGTPTGASASSLADVRVVDGTTSFVVGGVTVMPITVEKVAGASTGSLNSTFTIPLPQGGLTNGSSVSIDFKLGVFKAGSYRLAFLFEALVLDVPAVPNRPDDDNMLLGNPSGATVLNADQSNKENLLVEHNAFALGYQKNLGGPRWVSWHLDSDDLGSSGRTGNFNSDSKLPEDCRITDGDYSGSGYTRGHQSPSGDRTKTTTLNAETFLMSNMLPQTATLNNEVWADFENYCRAQAKTSGNELYIMSGGIGSIGRISGGKVNIPASCWKVAVILPKGTNDLSRINNSTRVISVIMPNTSRVARPYSNYYTTVDNIENLTGLDLLSNLPNSVENFLEASTTNR